jgi:hypothetical protein
MLSQNDHEKSSFICVFVYQEASENSNQIT